MLQGANKKVQRLTKSSSPGLIYHIKLLWNSILVKIFLKGKDTYLFFIWIRTL